MLQWQGAEPEHCGAVLCDVPTVIPRELYFVPVGKIGSLHAELCFSLQKLFVDRLREF